MSATASAATLPSIARGWREASPTIFKPTEIAALDALWGGKGIPLPRRVVLVGCPGAGKTALAVAIADALDRSGDVLVGFMAVDEEAEELGYRFAQMAGCNREKLEAQDPAEIDKADEEFRSSSIVFYSYEHTLDFAVSDLAARATTAGKLPALFVDSLSTATCNASKSKPGATPREAIEANIAVLEKAYAAHRMFVLTTAEANRAAYGSVVNMQNPLAAGAESRKIEFGFQTNIVLGIDDNNPAVTKLIVAKNRKYDKGEFSLKLNRETHLWEPADSKAEKSAKKAEQDAQKAATAKEQVDNDARTIVRLLYATPGLNTNKLHEAGKTSSVPEKRVEAALTRLGLGIAVVSGPNKARFHYLDGANLPPDILGPLMAELPNLAECRPMMAEAA